MIIGIYGTHAVGKTTFIQEYKDAFADNCRKPLHIVCADNGLEYHLTPSRNVWQLHKSDDWKADKATKVPLLLERMLDKDVWIIESARVFTGYGPELADCITKGGDIRFIIPAVEPDTMRCFLRSRCDAYGKEFNAEYWDDARLRYESYDRYRNFIVKHMIPMGTPYCTVWIDSERKAWGQAYYKILEWLQ